jgi:hypothetical protein
MLVETPVGRSLINEAAYRLISAQAPQELPLYVATRDRYFADPEAFTRQGEAEDRPLGFGSADVVEAFSYVVFPLLVPTLSYLVSVAKEFQEQTAQRAVEWVRDLFSKTPDPQPLLTQEQLAAVDRIIQEEYPRLGLRPKQVQAFQNALMRLLALATK